MSSRRDLTPRVSLWFFRLAVFVGTLAGGVVGFALGRLT